VNDLPGLSSRLAVHHHHHRAHQRAVYAQSAPIADALHTYETEMLAYGFDVVRAAAAMGTRLMGQRPLP
jgi:hypothetical protein